MALYFNCGYARVAAYEIARAVHGSTKNWQKLKGCDINSIIRKYQQCFHNRTQYKVDKPEYFLKHLRGLLPKFNHRWNPTEAKQEYLHHFSQQSWNKLPPKVKTFIIENGRFPLSTDILGEARAPYKLKHRSECLLSTWKISVHK